MSKFQYTNDMLMTILNASTIGMLVINSDGEIVFSNKKIEIIFGYNESELFGQHIDLLLRNELREGHKEKVNDFIEKPESKKMLTGRPLPGMTKNKHIIIVEVGLVPITIEKKDYVLASIFNDYK
ncbi:MAG: PAS domain S-box protein [Alcanivoracaceae bacterium]|nr:PAS domain S-box protein [Alcanivoracaceae bacterium]